MKKKRIILVNIIASFLLCCLICFITISVLYPISLTKYGPYHRPSILLRFSNDNTVIFQGDYYFVDNYNSEKDYIYRYSDNCFNPMYSLNKNNGFKIYADESYLYVSSHKTIRVYNRNLDLITSIKTKNSIMNMIVVDKCIYYSSLYAGVSIIKDFSNEQSIELKRGSFNLINGTNIYYSSLDKLFLQSDKNIVFLPENNNNMLIYHDDFYIIPENSPK